MPAQEPQQNLEMSLREHLLAAGASGSGPAPYPTTSAPPQNPDNPYPYQPSDSASPHDHHYDPNVAAQQQHGMSGDSVGEEGISPDSRKGKRELSTSKRAAQNRAAQRAFRQRKEGYIKKLEEQVKDFQAMEHNYRNLQTENYQLREYILNLQSRLLENQADFPPAPSHVNIPSANQSSAPDSSAAVEQQLRREMQGPHDAISQLQAAAAAADGRSSDTYEYPGRRTRGEESGPSGGDAKAGS